MKKFLSTPPSRVATTVVRLPQCLDHVISIHATLAGGDVRQLVRVAGSVHISIHATLAGGDDGDVFLVSPSSTFLSTPPSRVATDVLAELPGLIGISIHATLAGGDVAACWRWV